MSAREKRSFVVYGFESTHAALDAEALLDDMGIEVVPVPAPKEFGGLCGIGMRVPSEEDVRAASYLDRVGIRVVIRAETWSL